MKHLDPRIAAADPLRLDLSALPDEAGQALAQEIMMQVHQQKPVGGDRAPTPRRRRGLRLAALAVAGLIALPGTAAYAVYRGMHSGVFGDGGESVAGEEFYYSDSPEIVTELRELTHEFPLPAGYDYDPLLARYPTKERNLVQRTSLGQEVSATAACGWYRHWLGADPAGRAADQKTIDAIPTWRYWSFPGASSAGPAVPSPRALGSPAPTDDDSASVLSRIAEETRSGGETTVRQYLVANC